MKSSRPSSSPEGHDCGCCSSFGRPHLKECSRTSGHTCISNGDHECKACELLQNCLCKQSELHLPEAVSAIASHSVSASEQLTKDSVMSNAHLSSTVTKHQDTATGSAQATTGLVSNLEALFG